MTARRDGTEEQTLKNFPIWEQVKGAWGRAGLCSTKPPDGLPRLKHLRACPSGCDRRHPHPLDAGKLIPACS